MVIAAINGVMSKLQRDRVKVGTYTSKKYRKKYILCRKMLPGMF